MKNGFTLVEIMITLVIMMITSGGVIALMSSYSGRRSLDGVREEMISDLKLAKSMAENRKSLSDTDELAVVEVLSSGSSLAVQGYNVVDLSPFSFETFKTKVYGKNINISVGNSILFLAGSGKLAKSMDNLVTKGVGESVAIDISQSGDSTVIKKIIIDSSGKIE
jgi:prepilin-type N-terminal cleavage/methylation domain-containing protein